VPRPGLSAIVGHLIEQIERTSHGGAIRIAGYSYGCVLSHALVHELTRRGRAVAGPVVLLDGWLGTRDGLARPEMYAKDNPLCGRLERLALWVVRQAVPPGRRWTLRLASTAPQRWWAGRFGFYLRKHLGCVLLGPAAASYRPQPVGVDALLVRSAEHGPAASDMAADRAGADGLLGWAPFWAGIRVVDAPGDHLTMLDGAGLESVCAGVVEALRS
jgi:thioesterase domain-containing protein